MPSNKINKINKRPKLCSTYGVNIFCDQRVTKFGLFFTCDVFDGI